MDAELPKPMQSDARYSYDLAGNVTSIADVPLDGLSDVQCFRYDHLRRLVEAWTPTGDCTLDPAVEALGGPAPYWDSFTYDEVGNRLSQVEHTSDGDTVHEYAYPDGGHVLDSVTSQFPSGSTTLEQFDYDEAGNTVRRMSVEGEQTLEWDAEGNLVKSTKDEVVTEFLYDADGQRLLRRDPDGATLYLEGQELRWDRESGETTTTRYYSFGDSTVAMRTEAGVMWLLGDHQGTSRFAVDAQSMQVTRRWQLPFGGRRGPEVEFPGEKGFVGGTIDDSAGFVTLGARQYDPDLGRFLSVDPLMDVTDPQQVHGYSYSNNNPITYSDPSGLFFGWFKKVASTISKVIKRYTQRARWSGGGSSKKQSTRTAGYSRPVGGASGVGGASVAQNSFDIAKGHANGKHAIEFPGVSSEGLGVLVQEIMKNPSRAKELSGGRKACLGKPRVNHGDSRPDAC
ncbi:RHS repeat domain-containing protein [Saccharomonospora xinjiangensis]|uniref:RHS repeat domain-containing protein n=1 Tax=Saccharomonospora xinjiangensis TaxID=75294 RepID=UPI0035103567